MRNRKEHTVRLALSGEGLVINTASTNVAAFSGINIRILIYKNVTS